MDWARPTGNKKIESTMKMGHRISGLANGVYLKRPLLSVRVALFLPHFFPHSLSRTHFFHLILFPFDIFALLTSKKRGKMAKIKTNYSVFILAKFLF
jgi:hypothetical protein